MWKKLDITWKTVGGLIGLVTIAALLVAIIQLRQSQSDSITQGYAQSTEIAILQEQREVLREMATLQASSLGSGPSSTLIARQLSELQSTAIVLATKQASIYPFFVDFKVEAKKEWTNSKILISKDDIVSVKWLSGRWRTASTYAWTNGFECFTDRCLDCLSTQAPEASLLIRVGNGSMQCAGNAHYKSPETGNLWLSFNDRSGSFYDNEGEIVVQITISHE